MKSPKRKNVQEAADADEAEKIAEDAEEDLKVKEEVTEEATTAEEDPTETTAEEGKEEVIVETGLTEATARVEALIDLTEVLVLEDAETNAK